MGFSIPWAHWTATFILKVRFLVLGGGSVVEYLPVQEPRFPRLHPRHSSSHNNNMISLKGEGRMGVHCELTTWAATTIVHTQDVQRTPNCPHFPWLSTSSSSPKLLPIFTLLPFLECCTPKPLEGSHSLLPRSSCVGFR